MEPEARFTFIGAALLVLLLVVAGATMWLTRNGARAEFRYYTIYFERQSLGGLQVGGDVEMRGVQVGRVERFAISRDNINRVQATIRVDAKTPVSTNTVAVVNRKILTGLARIDLETPGEPGPELFEVREGEKYPVIAEGQSTLDHIADSANRIAVRGANVLASVDDLLNEKNRAEIVATLASFRGMADAIKTTAETAQQTARSADATAREATTMAREATTTAREATSTLRQISRTAAAVERATEVSTNDARATLQELRATAEIVARSADRLDNPRELLFGPNPAQLGPGEKLK